MPIPSKNTRCSLLRGLLIVFSSLSFAAGAAHAGGESAAAFLDIDVGARALGMGGSYVPLAMDETCLFWNPAALARIDGQYFGATHAQWYQDLQFEWAGSVMPVGQRFGTGIAATLLHSAPIAGYDEAGQSTGDFSVRDLAVTAGWGAAVTPGLAVGANAKAIQQSIAGVSVTSFAADVGVLASFEGWRFGALARNIGPRISYGADSYPLPFGVMLGAVRSINGSSLVSATLAGDGEGGREARVGAEWTWNRLLSLRGGYRAGLDGDATATGMTAGAGIRRAGWSLDYALTPHRDLGSAHRVSLSLRFGGARTEMPEAAAGCARGDAAVAGEPADPPAAGGFALYTNSRHSRIESARDEVRSLDLLGVHDARVMPAGTVYRVLVGYFRSREDADSRAASLRGSGFETEVVGP